MIFNSKKSIIFIFIACNKADFIACLEFDVLLFRIQIAYKSYILKISVS